MKLRQIINLLAVIVTLAVNGLANALPLNGKTTGEISDSYPVLFTPAGYVFAIWGLIYLGLIAFGIYQVLPAQKNNPRLERIGWWFVLSCIFNSVWIPFWHYDYLWLTQVAMMGLLLSLIVIYTRLEVGLVKVPTAERLTVDLPFSIYLGWISVATIANTAILLYSLGWNGGFLSPAVWTVIVLVVGLLLGLELIWSRGDIAYALVLVWAFFGITAMHPDVRLVAITAAAAAVVLLIASGVRLFSKTGRKTASSSAD